MTAIRIFRGFVACLALAIGVGSLTGSVAQAQDDVGLQAVYREAILNEPPWGLRQDDFSRLDESWNEWGSQVQAKLNKLYGFDPVTIEQQRQLLGELDDLLAETYPAMAEPEETASLDLLVDLEGKIARRLAIYRPMLTLIEQTGDEKKEKLIPQLGKILQTLERNESDDRDVSVTLNDPTPPGLRELVDQVRDLTGSKASRLADQIRVNYYNFNVRTFVSEPFADFAYYECRRERGPVCDYILGARVTGSQDTRSGVSIDFLPSDDSAQFAVRLDGNTRSKTRGVTDQATIFTYGNHYFTGKKVLEFDGTEFSYRPAWLGVNANNHVTGAKLNRRGLIAKLIGDKIAYEKAVDKKPQTERIAASRVRGRVLPTFNSEIEKTFDDLNADRKQLKKRLKKENIAPNEVLARTDEDQLRIAERLMNPGQLAADRATTVFNTQTGLTLHLHESWVNNSLAIDTLDLEAGQNLTFPEFSRQLAEKFRRAFEITRERKEIEGTEDKVMISDADPLHVQFEGGVIKVILRVGLKASDRDNPIAIRRVEIPVEFVMEEKQIRLQVVEGLDVYSKPLDTSDENYRRGEDPVIADRIRTRFEERLAEESFDRHLVLEPGEEGDKEVPVVVESLHAVNGWLVAVIEPDEAAVESRQTTKHADRCPHCNKTDCPSQKSHKSDCHKQECRKCD